MSASLLQVVEQVTWCAPATWRVRYFPSISWPWGQALVKPKSLAGSRWSAEEDDHYRMFKRKRIYIYIYMHGLHTWNAQEPITSLHWNLYKSIRSLLCLGDTGWCIQKCWMIDVEWTLHVHGVSRDDIKWFRMILYIYIYIGKSSVIYRLEWNKICTFVKCERFAAIPDSRMWNLIPQPRVQQDLLHLSGRPIHTWSWLITQVLARRLAALGSSSW